MARRKIEYGRKSAAIVGEIFGKNLARLRKEKDLSREALGEKIGVSGEALRTYEKGTAVPPLDRVFDIACALGVSITTLCSTNAESEEDILNEALSLPNKRARRAAETLALAGFGVQPLAGGGAVLTPPLDMIKPAADEGWGDVPAGLTIWDYSCRFASFSELWMFVEKTECDAVNCDEPLRPLMLEYMQRKMGR